MLASAQMRENSMKKKKMAPPFAGISLGSNEEEGSKMISSSFLLVMPRDKEEKEMENEEIFGWLRK